MFVRHVGHVSRKAATGRVADVYAQSTADFGQAAFMMLTAAPDLHAAAWAVLRESELVGQAPRMDKEIVAVAVSRANGCRFCVDAHTIMIHALGEHQLAEDLLHGRPPADPEHARLVAWASATRTPGATELRTPPFPTELATEYLGTALATHFTNRMFSTLTDEKLLPGNLQRSQSVRRVGAMAYARSARRRLTAGESLRLLADIPLGPVPGWAVDTPVGIAFAALRGAAASGGALLSAAGRDLLRTAVADWAGTTSPPADRWERRLASLPELDRPAARLALLVAMAPHGITDADVAAWRAPVDATDADLVRLFSFGAVAAVDRLADSITGREPVAPGDVRAGQDPTGVV